MIYERNTLASWIISSNDRTANSLLFLTNDGSYKVATYEQTGINASNIDLNTLIGRSANYFNRNLLQESNPLISIGYCFNKNDILFMNTNRADFFAYWSSASASVDGYTNVGDTADELTRLNNYYTDSGYSVTSDFQDYSEYTQYSLNITQQTCVFDYTNLYYASDGDKYFTPRGENLTFYTAVVEVSSASATPLNEIEIYYGAPYYSMSQSEYERGYGNGYASGYLTGKRDGYVEGYNAGGGAISGETATAFDYIGGAFEVVTNILEIQVLPHITLGLCFSIPLVLTLIMVIFKMVKK